MANHKLKSFSINLLIHRDQQTKLYERAFKWMLSSGRYIVIFVEILVIGAFVYRYKLDSDLSTLNDKIKEQVPYVKSLQPNESIIRQAQFQLTTIKQIRGGSPNWAAVLVEVSKLTPKNVRLVSVTLGQGRTGSKPTLTIIGITPSNLELSAFIQSLQKSSSFSDITLTNISFEGQALFTLTGTVKSGGGKVS